LSCFDPKHFIFYALNKQKKRFLSLIMYFLKEFLRYSHLNGCYKNVFNTRASIFNVQFLVVSTPCVKATTLISPSHSTQVKV